MGDWVVTKTWEITHGSQRDQVRVNVRPYHGLETVGRDQFHPGLQHTFQFPLQSGQSEKSDSGRNVHEKVDVAVRGLLTAGDAAEHADIRHAVRCGDIP